MPICLPQARTGYANSGCIFPLLSIGIYLLSLIKSGLELSIVETRFHQERPFPIILIPSFMFGKEIKIFRQFFSHLITHLIIVQAIEPHNSGFGFVIYIMLLGRFLAESLNVIQFVDGVVLIPCNIAQVIESLKLGSPRQMRKLTTDRIRWSNLRACGNKRLQHKQQSKTEILESNSCHLIFCSMTRN